MEKMVSISEREYNRLKNENNSLREFVNQFLSLGSMLKQGTGSRKKGPNAQAAINLASMTSAQMKEHFKNKIK